MSDLKTLRRLTPSGLASFEGFIASHNPGDHVPSELVDGESQTEEYLDAQLDAAKIFDSRFEFGEYLVKSLALLDFDELMSPSADAFWAWVAALYFDQLSDGRKKKAEHFIVVRKGFKGSLHYRHGPRTAFEMVRIHGESARVCLSVPMGTFGDMAEQLTSRYDIARHTGYFRAAAKLYLRPGGLAKGAASRARSPRKRKAGETRGMGGAARLMMAMNRLTVTFDTWIMSSDEILDVLPKEFEKFLE